MDRVDDPGCTHERVEAAQNLAGLGDRPPSGPVNGQVRSQQSHTGRAFGAGPIDTDHRASPARTSMRAQAHPPRP